MEDLSLSLECNLTKYFLKLEIIVFLPIVGISFVQSQTFYKNPFFYQAYKMLFQSEFQSSYSI